MLKHAGGTIERARNMVTHLRRVEGLAESDTPAPIARFTLGFNMKRRRPVGFLRDDVVTSLRRCQTLNDLVPTGLEMLADGIYDLVLTEHQSSPLVRRNGRIVRLGRNT
jgi:hypothetical protein